MEKQRQMSTHQKSVFEPTLNFLLENGLLTNPNRNRPFVVETKPKCSEAWVEDFQPSVFGYFGLIWTMTRLLLVLPGSQGTINQSMISISDNFKMWVPVNSNHSFDL